MISLLFMSVEGAADLAAPGHAHGDGAVYQVNDLDAAEKVPNSDFESEGDHCERCCHGHTASITALIASIDTVPMNGDRRVSRSPNIRNFAQAPPTPPPNA